MERRAPIAFFIQWPAKRRPAKRPIIRGMAHAIGSVYPPVRKLPFLVTGLCALIVGTAPQYNATAQSARTSDDLALTIYNDNLALVRDQRTLAYAKGRSVVTLPGVSSQIQAATVTFSAPGVGIIEQNFDYDLLTPAKLMEKAVGQDVKIVRTNPATGKQTTETATVLSVNNGVVLRIGDRIEVLRDDNIPTRVIFDKVPENLRADPTLSVMVESDQAGRKPTSLTYLSGGLGWQADYVALFDEAQGAMDFQGWVTLSNNTELSQFVVTDATFLVADAIFGRSDLKNNIAIA